MYAEALEAGLAETAQTFVDAAKDVQKSVSTRTVLVVVTYFDAAAWAGLPVLLLCGLNPVRTEELHRCSSLFRSKGS